MLAYFPDLVKILEAYFLNAFVSFFFSFLFYPFLFYSFLFFFNLSVFSAIDGIKGVQGLFFEKI